MLILIVIIVLFAWLLYQDYHLFTNAKCNYFITNARRKAPILIIPYILRNEIIFPEGDIHRN